MNPLPSTTAGAAARPLTPTHWLALLIDHLRPIRVPLGVVGLGALAALAVPQVQEGLRLALEPDARFPTFAMLWLLGVLLGIAVWYSARNAYRMRLPRWPSLSAANAIGFRLWLPRLLGASVPLLLAIAFWIARADVAAPTPAMPLGDFIARVGLLLLTAAALFHGFIMRVAWLNRARARRGLAPLPATRDRDQVDRIVDLGRAPRLLIGLALALNFALVVAVALYPGALDWLGAPSIVLLGGLFFAVTGGLLTLEADRRGIPILSLLVAVATLLHVWGINDNHRVRLNPEATTWKQAPQFAVPPSQTFDALWSAWRSRAGCITGAECVVVLVAAEGGGIRAAAWTHIVLARLDAVSDGAFSRRWFAGSGVSGGSLGLATAVLATRPVPGCRPLAADPIRAIDPIAAGRQFHTTDFLSPLLSNLFFVDLVTQRLMPWPMFNDRGRALSDAFERAGCTAFDSHGFASPLADLYRDATTAPPLLLLNTTEVASGARVIQHGLAALPDFGPNAWPGARDAAALLGPALPLGEAVLNSARFSWATPAGTVPAHDGQSAMQLVDGGYFENSGLTTIDDLIRALRRSDPLLRVHVVHISNDPALDPYLRNAAGGFIDGCAPAPRPEPALAGELMAPITALLATRSARGEFARRRLAAALDPARGDQLWHIRVCPGDRPLPLGWTISAGAWDALLAQAEMQLPPATVQAIVDAERGP